MSNHYAYNLIRELFIDNQDAYNHLKQHRNIENAVETCVQFLKPSHSELILLRYKNGLSYKDCATHMNLTPSQIKQRIKEAHRQIRQKIALALEYTVPSNILDTPLSMLHLTPNARFALSSNNLKTIRDVVEKPLYELITLPRIDKSVLRILLEALEHQNIHIHLTAIHR